MPCHMPITCLSCVCHNTHVQESREIVVFRLLDKIVATELVSPTVQSKVLPYVQRHGLKLDEVLLQYVKVGWEYEKGGCGLVPGLHQLENKAGWGLETRLGGKWWPRWIVSCVHSPTASEYSSSPSLPLPLVPLQAQLQIITNPVYIVRKVEGEGGNKLSHFPLEWRVIQGRS